MTRDLVRPTPLPRPECLRDVIKARDVIGPRRIRLKEPIGKKPTQTTDIICARNMDHLAVAGLERVPHDIAAATDVKINRTPKYPLLEGRTLS